MNPLEQKSPFAPAVEHYYGDRVRQLFLVSALFSFIAIPLWGSLLPLSLFLQICGGLVLVLLAGLTNPHSKAIMIVNAIASGLGALLIEVTVVEFRLEQSLQLLILREAEVLLLLVAFYLSVKTARAMFLGKVGQMDRPWEFEKETP